MYSIQLVRYKTCNIVLMAMESRPVSYMAMKLLNLLSLQIVVGQGTRGKLTQTYRGNNIHYTAGRLQKRKKAVSCYR